MAQGPDGADAEVSVAPREAGALSALRYPAFRNLWLAELLAQTAQNAIWYTALVATDQRTGSALQVSFSVAAATIPVALFGILAGILVDRWYKKRVLLVSNMVRAVLALGYLLYHWSVVFIFLMNFLLNTVAQFYIPAIMAAVPETAPRRLLTTAVGLLNVALTISQVVGMVLIAPALIKLFGVGAVFTTSSAVYFVAMVAVALVPVPRIPRQEAGQGGSALERLRRELAEGWAFVRGDRESKLAILYLTLTWSILLSLVTLAPRYAASPHGLRISADDAVFVLAPAGLGMGVAAALLGRLTRRLGTWRPISWSLLLLGGSLAALSLLGPIANWLGLQIIGPPGPGDSGRIQVIVSRAGVAMLLALVLGVGTGVVTAASQAALLDRAPADARGRVFALQQTVTNFVAVIPLLLVGVFADIIGLNPVIMIAGVIVFVVWLLTAHERRRAGLATPAPHPLTPEKRTAPGP